MNHGRETSINNGKGDKLGQKHVFKERKQGEPPLQTGCLHEKTEENTSKV